MDTYRITNAADGSSVTVRTDDREEGTLWKEVGKYIGQLEGDIDLIIESEGSEGSCTVKARGTELLAEGKIPPLKKVRYPDVYMTKIDEENNSYEFFKLLPHNMGPRSLSFGGSFGRIGAKDTDLDSRTIIRRPYKSCLFWPMYFRLLALGYEDQSEVYFYKEEEKEEIRDEEENEAAIELAEKLTGAAKAVVTEQLQDVSFLTESLPFNGRTVSLSWAIWKKMLVEKDVDKFNANVKKLMTYTARRIDPYRGMTVDSYLAKKEKDPDKQEAIFQEIIKREESLIRSMEALLGTSQKKEKTVKVSPFGDVAIREATEEEVKEVMQCVSNDEGSAPGDKQLKDCIKKVYRVIPGRQRQEFESYLEARDIKEDKVKLLWHGSANANWFSLIKNSPSRSYANSGMFSAAGEGVYFAWDPKKSAGYTNGGRWTGSDDEPSFYMGIFETAYGKPWFVPSPGSYTRAQLDKEGKDCIHAKRGKVGLYRDEFIFFDDAAFCQKYLVEFGY